MKHTNFPDQLVSGSTVTWTDTLGLYPSSQWQLSFHLRGVGALDVTATGESDDSYSITLTVASGVGPTPLPVGKYYWQAYVTNLSTPSDKRLIDSGRVSVLADLSSNIASFDGRSTAELMVDAIDAVLTKKATRDQESYTIGQRTLKRIPPDQLITWRQYYAKIVAAEDMQRRVAAGGSPFETIAAEFVSPQHRKHDDRDNEFFS